MNPDDLVIALGAWLPILLLTGVVSVVGAIVAGLALLRGHPNPLLVGSPVALPLLLSGVAAAIAMRGVGQDPTNAVAIAAGLRLIALFFALPAAAIVALFAAVAGGRGDARSWRRAGAVVALCTVTAALPVAGGIAEDDWLFPFLRGGLYLVLGLFLAAAHLGGAEHPDHPEAAATLGGLFALVVSAGEISARALETVFLLAVLVTVIPEGRGAYVEQGLTDVIGPSAPWHDAALVAGWITGAVAIGLAARGSRGVAWAAGWIVVGVALGPLGATGAAALRAVAAAPVVAPPP